MYIKKHPFIEMESLRSSDIGYTSGSVQFENNKNNFVLITQF